jgi:hypothetical protein
MNRRQVIKGLLAAPVLSALPTFRFGEIILYGDGLHDDTEALQAWINMERVYWTDGKLVGQKIYSKVFNVTKFIDFTSFWDGTSGRHFCKNVVRSIPTVTVKWPS